MKTHTLNPISIDGPMVIISAQEYQLLLREAGYEATPRLDKRITQARYRLRNKKFLSWDKVKHVL